jgi:hypothetical protein
VSLRHVNARQLALIFRYTLRHSIRSGSGLVFLLLALFFGLTVANAIVSPFEQLVAQTENLGVATSAEVVEQNLVSFARPAVEWAIAPSASDDPAAQRAADERTERWADYLLDDRPALLSAIFLVLLFGVPLLVPFGAFNQTAGDIGNRGLRYLLLRTERANIYYGRLLATAAFAVGVQAVVVLTIALYLGFKVNVYDGMEIASWSVRGFVALALASAVYVALCAWLSAGRDSPMAALVMCNLVIGGVLLGSFLAAFAWEPARYSSYLLPWPIQNLLLAPDLGTVAWVAAACVGYIVAFTWLGAYTFENRDL